MASYYVNKNPQPTGEHEVHKSGCSCMPIEIHKKYLGNFTNCHAAVRKAREYFTNVDGCKHCSKECHTR